MRYIDRKSFEARPHRCGLTAWNPDAVASQAFKRFPQAIAVSWDYCGTGLWIDVRVHEEVGSHEERLFF